MSGAAVKDEKKFVIQEHSSDEGVHWDFMLESGQILETYRLDNEPKDMLKKETNGVKIFDHQLKFLTYHGPVNNGRGSVAVVESGTYRIISRDETKIELKIAGQTLDGNCTLTKIKNDNWRFGVIG